LYAAVILNWRCWFLTLSMRMMNFSKCAGFPSSSQDQFTGLEESEERLGDIPETQPSWPWYPGYTMYDPSIVPISMWCTYTDSFRVSLLQLSAFSLWDEIPSHFAAQAWSQTPPRL
jgi:hypothetical protein